MKTYLSRRLQDSSGEGQHINNKSTRTRSSEKQRVSNVDKSSWKGGRTIGTISERTWAKATFRPEREDIKEKKERKKA